MFVLQETSLVVCPSRPPQAAREDIVTPKTSSVSPAAAVPGVSLAPSSRTSAIRQRVFTLCGPVLPTTTGRYLKPVHEEVEDLLGLIEMGGVVGVIGPSQSGKTTLIHALAARLRPAVPTLSITFEGIGFAGVSMDKVWEAICGVVAVAAKDQGTALREAAGPASCQPPAAAFSPHGLCPPCGRGRTAVWRKQ